MKRLWIILLLSLLVIPLFAQRDPSTPDTIDHEVANQASWYNDALPKDVEPKRDSILVSPAEIPAKLKHALSSKDEYGGWESGKIYYDRTTKIYKVYISENQNTRVYGFSPEGHVVMFRAFKK